MCQSCFNRRAVKRLKGLQDELRDVVEAFIDRGTADDIERVLTAVRGDQSAKPGEFIAAPLPSRVAGLGQVAGSSNDRRSNEKAPAFFTGADDV